MYVTHGVISDQKLAEPLLQLQRAHESALRKSALIAANLREVDSKPQKERLRNAVSSIRQLRSFLTDHESNEERILTPIIGALLDPEASATVKKEYAQICDLLQKLEKTAFQIGVGKNPRIRRDIVDLLAQVDASIRARFSREENVLFWLASLHMSKSN